MTSSTHFSSGFVAIALILFAFGCSDGAACKEPQPAVETDRLLGPPVESVDAEGCKVHTSRKRIDGERTVQQWRWTSGGPVFLAAGKGSIEVVAGSGDGITLTVRPFTTLAEDASGDEVRAALELEKLNVIPFNSSGDELQGIIAQSFSDSTNGGADITIGLPPGFDGRLELEQKIGSISATFTGDARQIEATSGGPCDLAIGPRAASLYLNCPGLTATIADFPSDFVSAWLSGSDGSVKATFHVPSHKNYVVSGLAPDGRVAIHNADAAGCIVSESKGSLKYVVCGSDAPGSEAPWPGFPMYHVSAGPSGSVALGF